jgi:chromosome segregation ATPase
MLPASIRKEMAAFSVATVEEDDDEECCQDRDLITMRSPSPKKDIEKAVSSLEAPSNLEEKQGEWKSKLEQKDAQIIELEKQIQEKLVAIENLKNEVRLRRESEEQMQQIIKQYEKVMCILCDISLPLANELELL